MSHSLAPRRVFLPRTRMLPGCHDGPCGSTGPADWEAKAERDGHVRFFLLRCIWSVKEPCGLVVLEDSFNVHVPCWPTLIWQI